MNRCPECGLYTKYDARIIRPWEECRLCGVVRPVDDNKDEVKE